MIRYIGEKKQHPLRNALIQYAPEGVEGEEWLDDEEQVKEAALRWGAAMKTFLPEDHFSSEKQRERRYRE